MHQTVKVDTQSAYLGTTSRADLIKTISLMSNKGGPRAPVKLDAVDLEDDILENHPELSALVIERKRLKAILKAECRTAAGAKALQPEKYREYNRLTRRIGSTRNGLKCSALKDLRAKFFENADHEEIRQQLKVRLPPHSPTLSLILVAP